MFLDIPLVQIMIKTGNPRYKIGGLNIQFILYLGFYLIKQFANRISPPQAHFATA